MYTLWEVLSTPIKWGWRLINFTREFILNVLLILFFIIIVGVFLQVRSSSSKLTEGALIIDLIGTVVDKPETSNKFKQISREFFNFPAKQLQENSVFEIVNILRQARIDKNITGLVLSLKNFSGADQTSLQYIGKALFEFRNSGKPIYSVGDSYSQAQYFLASYADQIYLTPQGTVDLHGIAMNNLYYKSLFDKLKINSHIFRVGTYKSAVEPFLRNNMSNDAREADTRWMEQLWAHYLKTTAANRKMTPQQLFPGAKVMLEGLKAVKGNTAQFALNNKWVDEVMSRSMINKTLIKKFGQNKNSGTFKGISIYDYQPSVSLQKGEKIAVIFANGAIIDGLGTRKSIGGDTIGNQIRDARLDPSIKAIIFRINSPGGSVTASEVIRSELASVREDGKPIVVSMGGVAASGGYWIATPANYIISGASTLTGSIGIFGLINTLEGPLDSIGVHTDGVATSPLADVSITKALPSEFSQMMQLNVENGYHNFLNLVAKSRHKTLEEADKISQGHVWIGSDAKQKGLVDQLGDFDDAIKKAAELAKLKQYQLSWYLDEPSILDLLLMQICASAYSFMPNVMQSFLVSIITQIINQLTTDSTFRFQWNDPQNRYAFCFSGEQIIK